MRKYIYFPITFFVSLIFHIALFIFMPGINFNIEKPQNTIIEIEIYEPKIEKPTIPKNTNQSQASQKKEKPNSPAPKIEEKQLISADKVMEEAKVEVSSTIPAVDLPEYNDEPQLPLQAPGFENLVSISRSDSGKIKGLASEIAAAKASTNNSEATLSTSEGNENNRSNFFEIQSASNMQRKLLRPYPPKPEFSLESSTTVILSFMVDENGNTYNIVPVTRSAEKIENIAIDYVKKLNFEAVSYSEPDKVTIKLFFEVK